MGSVLVHTAEEPVTIPARAARRLLDRGDGDAALLYMALLRHQGTLPPRALAGELRWERGRIEAAEQVLRELELVAAEVTPPPSGPEKPDYRQEDIAAQLEGSEDFRDLTHQVELRLGRKLSTPDLGILLGLWEHVGLPSDVIYLLVCHCAEKIASKYGEGRRPTLRQIEKEGYAWARMGVDTQRAAADYLKRYALRQREYAAYMRVLRLGDRLPVASEEKYLSAWQDLGFPAESVALAYDRTVLHCHEFKWSYCNGILRRWHKEGLHTAAEIETGDRLSGTRSRPTASSDSDFREYAQELRQGKEP